jgi:hypothetical protein
MYENIIAIHNILKKKAQYLKKLVKIIFFKKNLKLILGKKRKKNM